mmetsp:Transcript_28286/g.74207  ORF Transcript_28286/g.74207 Transcript_28286/m.74207 type:complete len:625 (-) Transcript_28286:70-1944(-)
MAANVPSTAVDKELAAAGGEYWSPFCRVALQPCYSLRNGQWQVPETYDVGEIIKGIKQNGGSKLRTVELSRNTFALEACEEIAGALSKCRQLEIFLCNDTFTSRLKTMIHPALGCLTDALIGCNLTVMDLSDNAVNPRGAELISPWLSQCITLKELYLNNTGVGPAGGVILANALVQVCANAKAAGQTYGLERFVLGRSRLEEEGAMALAIFFEQMSSLIEVRMIQNGIAPEGAAILVRSLAGNYGLEVLDLSDNRLKLAGAHAIGDVLGNFPRLRRLLISDNLMRHPQGGMVISKALSQNKALQELDLSGNDFVPEVGTVLKDVLLTLPNLTRVNLAESKFPDELSDEIASALSRAEVDLEDQSEFDEQDMKEIAEDADDLDFLSKPKPPPPSKPPSVPSPEVPTAAAAATPAQSAGSKSKFKWGKSKPGTSSEATGADAGATSVQHKAAPTTKIGSRFGQGSKGWGRAKPTESASSAAPVEKVSNSSLHHHFSDLNAVRPVCSGLVQLSQEFDGSGQHSDLVKRIWTPDRHGVDVLNSFMVALGLIEAETPVPSLSTNQIVGLWQLLDRSQNYLSHMHRKVIAVIASSESMRERGLDRAGAYASQEVDQIRKAILGKVLAQK